jgi:hypothetical protein
MVCFYDIIKTGTIGDLGALQMFRLQSTDNNRTPFFWPAAGYAGTSFGRLLHSVDICHSMGFTAAVGSCQGVVEWCGTFALDENHSLLFQPVGASGRT